MYRRVFSLNTMKYQEYLLPVLNIIKLASKAIIEVYNRPDFSISRKKDNSPITLADRKSHKIITEELTKLYPDIPILSEEGKDILYNERKKWSLFWLIDPLDGTKEFIKRNGEFTINIGLIEKDTPVFGIVLAPLSDECFFGVKQIGAYKLKKNTQLKEIENKSQLLKFSQKLPLNYPDKPFTVIASRSHQSEKTGEYIDKLKLKYKKLKVINRGSALKLCMIAEAKADVYPRLSPSYEWDIGAGHAIVNAVGGSVIDQETKKPLKYNKENLVNPHLVAYRKKQPVL